MMAYLMDSHHYTMASAPITKVLPSTVSDNSINFSCLAFMDDTTLIITLTEFLEDMMQLELEFYTLNNIRCNPDKSVLIMNRHPTNQALMLPDTLNPVTFRLSPSSTVSLTPLSLCQSFKQRFIFYIWILYMP
jgi:hypothetical protein